jgi:lipoprotein-anchoring transpeptidase ErfK/SrfK
MISPQFCQEKYAAVGALAAILILGTTATLLPGQAPAARKSAAPTQAGSASRLLSQKNINAAPTKFPLRIPESGPLALHLQILLDRAGFSPGIIDAAWGINAAKAITFFTRPDDSERLTGDSPPSVKSIDQATYERLRAAAPATVLLRRYTVTREDVAGPFVPTTGNAYQQAKLPCLCYSSPAEMLAERFHTSRKLLGQLNPGVKLDKLARGTTVTVPNVALDGEALPQDTAIVARLIISKKGYWTHAIDAAGRIIYHFPSTLGAGYDPSPTGDFKVTYVSRDPAFHYQPKLFSEVPDDEPEARLPPGPNSPVGVVWISLSKPHYGIHGTGSPETIGYANSHGCVRLTNWDALKLSDLVEAGTPVQFK